MIMSDAPSGERKQNLLTYPLADVPNGGDGSAVQIVPGIFWLRMPMSEGFGTINVWALADGDGWTIVDTGMRTPKTVEAWRLAFDRTLERKPVLRTIVTHLHPDHSGLAGWFASQAGAKLWMTRLEFLMAHMLTIDVGREAPREALDFYKAAGWPEAALDRYRARFGELGRYIYPLPRVFRRIADGDQILIGDHIWEVVVGSGHSPEHACLYCKELKLMISGDQILPRISSNISVHPLDSEADPLSEWLRTLAVIRERLPHDVLILPAHGEPFHGVHERIDQLIDGHEITLDRLSAVLRQPCRPVDIFSTMFHRPITPQLFGMATGESIAHLHCLRARGLAARSFDGHGAAWWTAIPPSAGAPKLPRAKSPGRGDPR